MATAAVTATATITSRQQSGLTINVPLFTQLVGCHYDCKCNLTVLDAHHDLRTSPLDLMYLTAHIENATSATAAEKPRRCGFKLTVGRERPALF